MCWDLNPQPVAYEARTPPQDHLGKWERRVLKFVLNKACPVFYNLAVGSEFGQFGKMLLGAGHFLVKPLGFVNSQRVT